MIAANEAVGRFFRRRNAPTVWRVHAPPAADRVSQLAETLGAFGIQVDVVEAQTPLGMKRVLDQIAEKPGAQALSFQVLRTLTQAVWDTVPVGHFGLASGDYLHFTSPIRRYPDTRSRRLPSRRSASSPRHRARTSGARWKPSARRSRCTARTSCAIKSASSSPAWSRR